MGWLKVREIDGGQVVECRLCGKRAMKRRVYRAADTNYAEALRLATAFAWQHEHSDQHQAALAAFHSREASQATAEEKQLDEIFGSKPRTETELRREAARKAAQRCLDQAKH